MNSSLSRYKLAPGCEWVCTDSETVIVRSLRYKAILRGKGASIFSDRVMPLLDGSHDLEDIANAAVELNAEQLQGFVSELAGSGLISNTSNLIAPGFANPLVQILASEGRKVENISKRLSDTVIAVFGLESTGAILAEEFLKLGVKNLLVIDPEKPRSDDPSQLHMLGKGSRQENIQNHLASRYELANISAPIPCWEKTLVMALGEQVDLMVCAIDRDFASVAHWVNRSAVANRKVAAFCQIEIDTATAGPIVFPGESACFMCYKMRSIACADDYAADMAFEEKRDRARAQSKEREATFIPSINVIAGIMCGEIVKTLTASGRHAAAGKMLEWNGMEGKLQEHPVYMQPSCPVCSKKKFLNPPFPDDISSHGPENQLALCSLESKVVSQKTGILRSLSIVPKPPAEPEFPRIYRAELSNFRYHKDKKDAFQIASGKGLTDAEARSSAIGEAVERYSGSIWSESTLSPRSRKSLEQLSLDPRRLCLYSAEQYKQLSYSRYDDDLVLGWSEGLSFPNRIPTLVPTQPVLMSYALSNNEGNLCQVTSNGLAAGSTLADAALRATLEVIERDSFTATWFAELKCEKVDPFSIPDEKLIKYLNEYGRRGVSLELYKMPSTLKVACFVALGIGSARNMPAVTVGLGADADPIKSARSALLEVGQVRPSLKYRTQDKTILGKRDEMLKNSDLVVTLEDHDLYYSGEETLDSFDFIRKSKLSSQNWQQHSKLTAKETLIDIAHQLATEGSEIILFNLTPDDMRELGLYTVRAIVPDYQPISFGHRERRVSEKRLKALAPHSWSSGNFNPRPHPLA